MKNLKVSLHRRFVENRSLWLHHLQPKEQHLVMIYVWDFLSEGGIRLLLWNYLLFGTLNWRYTDKRRQSFLSERSCVKEPNYELVEQTVHHYVLFSQFKMVFYEVPNVLCAFPRWLGVKTPQKECNHSCTLELFRGYDDNLLSSVSSLSSSSSPLFQVLNAWLWIEP